MNRFLATLVTVTLFSFCALANAQAQEGNTQTQETSSETATLPTDELNDRIDALELNIADIDKRTKGLEDNAEQDKLFAWLTLLIALVAALAGAGLGGYMSDRSSRRSEKRAFDLRAKEASTDICSQWISMSPSIASAFKALDGASSVLEPDQINSISMYGNWLEMVLLMRDDGLLDRGFLDSFEFNSKVETFKNKVEAAKAVDSRLSDYLLVWEKISKN